MFQWKACNVYLSINCTPANLSSSCNRNQSTRIALSTSCDNVCGLDCHWHVLNRVNCIILGLGQQILQRRPAWSYLLEALWPYGFLECLIGKPSPLKLWIENNVSTWSSRLSPFDWEGSAFVVRHETSVTTCKSENNSTVVRNIQMNCMLRSLSSKGRVFE